jgi:riboflavin kinase/FMN adenylyltransferase
MLVIDSFKDLPDSLPGPVLAIGVFDGVHVGHQRILAQLVKRARNQAGTSIVLTFHPHPQKVISPADAPLLLQTPFQKRQILSRLGVEVLIEVPFTRRLSLCTPDEFVSQVLGGRGVREIHVGRNFRFGHRRSGSFETLSRLAAQQKITVVATEPVRFRGKRVSSTRVRRALLQGRASLARHLLGRPYEAWGTVVRGGGKGTGLGFPTANLQLESELIPANGVYATRAYTNGGMFLSVTNIGLRPTLASQRVSRPLVEVHLLDFSGDLYGKSIGLELCFRIRGEKRFENLDRLRQQIARDVARARGHLVRI